MPQRKRATSTTWDGIVGTGCRARAVQGRHPHPTLHLSFAPDFGNSSPNVQNRALKTRKVDLFRPNARCAANRVGRRASTLRHIYFIIIKDGEWVGGYPCGQASSRTSAEKAHNLHLYHTGSTIHFAHSSQIPTQDMRLGEGNGDSIHHSQGKQWRQPHGR